MSLLDTLTDDGLQSLLDVRDAAEAFRSAVTKAEAAEAKADLDEALNRADRAGVGE